MKRIAFLLVLIAAAGAAFVRLRARGGVLAMQQQRAEDALAAHHRAVASQLVRTKDAGAGGLARPGSEPAAQPAAPRPAAVPAADRGRLVRQKLVHMPEFAPLRRREFEQRAMTEYGPWFAQLAASPERLQQIKAAVTDAVTRRQDAFDALFESGLPPASPEYGRMFEESEAAADAAMKAALSPEDYARWQAYEKVKWFTTMDLPEIEDFFAERGTEALSPAQKQALGEAWQQAAAWAPAEALKPGALARARTAQAAEFSAHALNPEQRTALQVYVDFANARSQRRSELMNPADPDSIVSGDAPGQR